MIVLGGTITDIKINDLVTGLTSGLFYVKSGAAITVDGSVAPTSFTVIPAAWSQY